MTPVVEIWAIIPRYGGKYSASNKGGRIKSNRRKVNTGNGGWRIIEEKILTPKARPKKQFTLSLYYNGGYKTEITYRLVAKAFLPNPKKKRCVNHKDGNRLNNDLSNLEWATHSENQLHAIRTGLNNPIPNLPRNHKSVIRISDTGKLKIFESASDAARSVAGVPQGILAVCNNYNSYKTAYGYKWTFL